MAQDPKFDDVTPGGVVAAVAAEAAGGALDFIVPGGGGVVSAAMQALINVAGRGWERRRERALQMVEAASDSAGLPVEDLLERAESDDARIELTLRALHAAARATTEAKIHALGTAFASGVLASDDATVDIEAYVIDALDRLEAPHIRVLAILAENRVPQQNAVMYKVTQLAWPVPAIAQKYPQAGDTLPSLVATLVSIGAVDDVARGTADYRPTYSANDFGRMLLARLRAVGTSQSDPA